MVCRMRNCVNVCLTGEHLLKFQNFAQFPKYTKSLYYVIRETINWTLPGGYRTLVNIMQWIMHTSYSTIKRNRLNDDLPRWQCYLCSCLSSLCLSRCPCPYIITSNCTAWRGLRLSLVKRFSIQLFYSNSN